MPKRVAVNASALLQPHAGIGTYVREILLRLPALAPDFQVDLFLGHKWAPLDESISLLDRQKRFALEAKALNLPQLVKKVPGSRALWHLFKGHSFQKLQQCNSVDVWWEPCFIPPRSMSPMVLTVHDLSHVRYPEAHPVARVKWLNGLEQAIRKADQVIAVSQFTKDEIIDVYGDLGTPISMVPNGLNIVQNGASDDLTDDVLKAYGIGAKEYFLSVCTLEPRKNLNTLIAAYDRLPDAIKMKTPLVLVGGSGWGQDATVTAFKKLCPNGKLIFTGYVPDQDLQVLYKKAKGFFYPSVYEGFGLPAVEAMQYGTPTVLSEALALKEVSGGAAYHVESLNVEAWENAFLWVLELTETQRAELSWRLKARAADFSWDETARLTLDCLRRTIDD